MCVFCDEANDPSLALNFLGEDWPFQDRLLLRDENSFVVPGYGPQVFPYALVITQRHIRSLSESTAAERASILRHLAALATLPAFRSEALSVFEHVALSTDLDSCLTHCHLHVVAGAIDFRGDLERVGPIEEATLGEQQALSDAPAYLFFGKAAGELSIKGWLVKREAPSQFFRKLIAEKFNLGEWDWRIGMNPHLMLMLAAQAKQLLQASPRT